MRKSSWVVALLLVAINAPGVWADSFDASFSCTTACVAVPTDPAVTFPSPTIPISFFSQSFTITLNAFDNPTDDFTWGIGTDSSGWHFEINDLTTGWSDDSSSFSFGQDGTPYGNGCVYFDHQSMPEPSSLALMLLGIGIVFLARRRLRQSLPRAS
jgi:hypothetical protein